SISLDQTFRAITESRMTGDNRFSCEVPVNITRQISYCGVTHAWLLVHREQNDRVKITAQQPSALRVGSNCTGRRRNLLAYHQSKFLTRRMRSGKPMWLLIAQQFIEERT